MAEAGSSIEPKRQGRFKPRAFARALIEGKTQAEAARIAGSAATSEAALATIGSRWMRHPSVQKVLKSIDPAVTYGISGGVQWWAKVANGLESGIEPHDRTEAIDRLCRIKGLFVVKHQHQHEHVVVFKGGVDELAPAGDASLSNVPTDALEAELARRRAVIDVEAVKPDA